MIDDWLNDRPDWQDSPLLFTDRDRPIPGARVDHAVRQATAEAGIGHVHPHQLRHTLATQAVNRGMSLGAIAALLGHKTMTMTLVYARIADRTVAEHYFMVTEKVKPSTSNNDPPCCPPADEPAAMRKVRSEHTSRMLGNGYCSRPVDLDCHCPTRRRRPQRPNRPSEDLRRPPSATRRPRSQTGSSPNTTRRRGRRSLATPG